ncbi:MAG: ferrous iron transport protein A [Eubacteriaceae bacterium]|jgi:ferrous iron transport protein A|nr:ferrous iron transport protein A [Eubacteriaceae bacterium]
MATVTAIKVNTRFLSRIASIGLTPGCRIKVLRNDRHQPILLYGRDSMIAVNRR